MAAAATTIAAPLWFYADKNTDVVTAAEFMKEANARILGNVAITTDAQRIGFVVGCLRGTAQHWWNTITRSEPDHDIETWDGFRACFAEEFCVPGNKAGNFDISDVQRQKPGELPRRYFQRVAQFFADKLPLAPYAKDETTRAAAAATSAELIAAGGITEAKITAAVQKAIKTSVEKALLDVTGHQIRQIWIHGLDKPAREAAKAENKRLTLPQLFRHVDQYASDSAKKDNHSNKKNNKKKIFEVDDEADTEVQVQEVKKIKQCSFCHRRGHLVKDCYRRPDADKKQTSKGKGAAVHQSQGNKGNNVNNGSKSTTFPDQEKARFVEYMSRAFAVFNESNANGTSNAVNDPILYPQGF